MSENDALRIENLDDKISEELEDARIKTEMEAIMDYRGAQMNRCIFACVPIFIVGLVITKYAFIGTFIALAMMVYHGHFYQKAHKAHNLAVSRSIFRRFKKDIQASADADDPEQARQIAIARACLQIVGGEFKPREQHGDGRKE